jgi:predicted NodU family carbamoyl transferase
MYTLGINSAFHDSSACILIDGKLLAAAEEERFTHVKHAKRPLPFSAYELPFYSIDYCLNVAGIHLNDVDHIAYSFDPDILLKDFGTEQSIIPNKLMSEKRSFEVYPEWTPLFLSYILNAPSLLRDGYPHMLQKRALDSRSILASPISSSMQARLNDIKDREDFRPVAPVVLEDDTREWFEEASYSPFMLFVYNVKKDKEEMIPAVRHVDGTARIQTVNPRQHPGYYELLSEFKKITGVPVLVNTSFNTRGEPIVCTPRDAIECFWTSPFDALVINSFLLEKDLQQAR